MKQFLLLLILISLAPFANAQIKNGEFLEENLVFTDLDGNQHDVYEILDSGKSVILDVFATWCGPCWSFHRTETLKAIYEFYGPAGSDQVRVFAIEGDDSTSLEDMFQESDRSYGNWVDGVPYPFANTSDLNDILKIAFYPTLYVIRPDRRVLEMGDYRYNPEIWSKAIDPAAEKDIYITSAPIEKSFCTVSVFSTKHDFINLGTTEINEVDAELTFGTETVGAILQDAIGIFQTGKLPFSNRQIKESMDVTLKINSIDGVADVPEDEWVARYVSPLINNEKFVVKFTTDFYPGETTFKVSGSGKTLLNETFQAGPGTDGGGGDDANKEFVYELEIPEGSINCLTFNIADGFGDGLTGFDSSRHPVPGIVIENLNGDVLKENLGEWNFETTVSAFSRVDLTSAVVDSDIVEEFNMYPNPVGSILNFNLTVKDNSNYSVFVTDITGKVVSNIAQNSNFVNVDHLNQGLYFLNVKTDKGLFAEKFSKL
ncbi:MAG: T9SS type A sorting domain-containing protein [Saprospiraceae bacterium]